jgi:hypothetical protein
MNKSIIAATITAIAFAVIAPCALALAAPSPDMGTLGLASRNNETDRDRMGGKIQGQGAMIGFAQDQGGYHPGIMGDRSPVQDQSQGTYAPGAMSSYSQDQDAHDSAMAVHSDYSWMHEFGAIWMLILVVIGIVGAVIWDRRAKWQ